MQLRSYQSDLTQAVRDKWAEGYRNVCAELATGGGKTRAHAVLVREHNGASCTIAHRQELVGQLSLALAREGISHNVIAAATTRRACAAEHMAELGRNFVEPNARAAVASVATLTKASGLDAWMKQVTLVGIDETHHLVLDNQWGKALDKFTNKALKVVGWTATPQRADGKGLGRGYGGMLDVMVHGPPMRWLIEQGYLTDYDMVCVESDITRMLGDVGPSGDHSQAKLKDAAAHSHIVGNTIEQYLRWARGKLTITFTTDIDTASNTSNALQAAGVRAQVLTGDTDPTIRREMLKRAERGQIDNLCVVDIVSEGFDLPAVLCAIFARPTESLALYMQQFGRALRPIYAKGFDLSTQIGRLAAIAASIKPRAIIIDQVNNFLRFGPPDRPRPWTLQGSPKRSSPPSDLRACLNPLCAKPYGRAEPACPYCGTEPPPPAVRSSPAAVDGDLTLLDPATLDALRAAVATVNMDVDAYRAQLVQRGAPILGVLAHAKRHAAQLEAQTVLREAANLWAGRLHAAGRSDRYIHRLFWVRFNIDVMTAQTLKAEDALALRDRIKADG